MKFNYLKERKEFISVLLFGVSAVLVVGTLVRAAGTFMGVAEADKLVSRAVAKSKPDPNQVEKCVTEAKKVAEELKKKNLYAPPPPKKNPVSQVAGIMGSEALINGKWYKVGDEVGDAKIVAIEPTLVKVEWEGKEHVFAPIGAAGSGSRDKREKRRDREEGKKGPEERKEARVEEKPGGDDSETRGARMEETRERMRARRGGRQPGRRPRQDGE
jgi:hypothetical protein